MPVTTRAPHHEDTVLATHARCRGRDVMVHYAAGSPTARNRLEREKQILRVHLARRRSWTAGKKAARMRVGGTRRLVIPPSSPTGGRRGTPSRGQTLTFESSCCAFHERPRRRSPAVLERGPACGPPRAAARHRQSTPHDRGHAPRRRRARAGPDRQRPLHRLLAGGRNSIPAERRASSSSSTRAVSSPAGTRACSA